MLITIINAAVWRTLKERIFWGREHSSRKIEMQTNVQAYMNTQWNTLNKTNAWNIQKVLLNLLVCFSGGTI